jgi:hypothetical protein
VHRYSSLLQWSVPLGQRGHAAMVRRILCTVTTDLVVWHSNTQNDFSPGAAIFSLHTLASPSGRNVNYDEKQISGGKKNLSCSFYLYSFRKYVSYGFPIITFCNPGVHFYETPCIKNRFILMYVPCILWLFVFELTNAQMFITKISLCIRFTPTCFDISVPSSGIFKDMCLAELRKLIERWWNM